MQTKLTALFPVSGDGGKQSFVVCTTSRKMNLTADADQMLWNQNWSLVSTEQRHAADPRRASCRHWWMVIGWKPLRAAWLQRLHRHQKRIIWIHTLNLPHALTCYLMTLKCSNWWREICIVLMTQSMLTRNQLGIHWSEVIASSAAHRYWPEISPGGLIIRGTWKLRGNYEENHTIRSHTHTHTHTLSLYVLCFKPTSVRCHSFHI